MIQYKGGQEYRPHCDGSCDGSPHLHAGRVATMLIYCQAAESGGGTTFSKAGVYVKPRKGQAVFFSYRGEERMDMELTEHSGCPVKNGVKWVVTQWIRQGVSRVGWTTPSIFFVRIPCFLLCPRLCRLTRGPSTTPLAVVYFELSADM